MSNPDYVVVGAGSSGAVVAARLAEYTDARVLLVEAGPGGFQQTVKIPAAFPQQFRGDLDWEYWTEPEPHLGGRRIYMPRGKMLGGCSGQNAMIYIRGNRSDYDSWAAGGATGWSYDDLLPLFKRSENNSRGASTFHGGDGPLYISDPQAPNPLSEAIVEGFVATGSARNDDFNGAEQLGAGLYQVSQRKGLRWTTNDGYVKPARKRDNFMVLADTRVHRVAFEDGRAVGIVAERRDGTPGLLRAEREVVLSAGALATPQLLMLSGIGPADHLGEFGIDVVVDNDNVGSHYMDHPMYMLNFETTMSGTLAEAENPVQLLKLLATRSGLLTSNIGEAGAFFHTRDDDAPDQQFIAAPGYFNNHGFDSHDAPAYAIGCSMVGARSVGEVRLKSADPTELAAVTANYFAEPSDMDSMVAAIERAREVTRSGPLADLTVGELHPGPEATTRAELEDEIRRSVEHTYHPTCTARIGSEADGVVDASLKVHGVEGLRVADASVFPTIPHGNTHAPAVVVGEKAADLITAEA